MAAKRPARKKQDKNAAKQVRSAVVVARGGKTVRTEADSGGCNKLVASSMLPIGSISRNGLQVTEHETVATEKQSATTFVSR